MLEQFSRTIVSLEPPFSIDAARHGPAESVTPVLIPSNPFVNSLFVFFQLMFLFWHKL